MHFWPVLPAFSVFLVLLLLHRHPRTDVPSLEPGLGLGVVAPVHLYVLRPSNYGSSSDGPQRFRSSFEIRKTGVPGGVRHAVARQSPERKSESDRRRYLRLAPPRLLAV
jgi:hypothetical protein